MVLYVLKAENGQYLSVKQIQDKIFTELAYSMGWRTIIGAIDQAKYVTGNIAERIERRGIKKVTVKVFAIITPSEILNIDTHEHNAGVTIGNQIYS